MATPIMMSKGIQSHLFQMAPFSIRQDTQLRKLLSVREQSLVNRIEQEILHGNEKDFEVQKTIIVGKEAKGLEFVYFAPHDDWMAKKKEPQPKQKSSQNPQNTEPKTTTPLPHKQKSNLTPGEIEAIKALRADPNIPKDAKPPLPEGY